MTKGARDNSYYLLRFKKEHPGHYADILAGKTTVSAVRKLVGLGAKRTRLHELKNAWSKASAKEQADFLAYARLVSAPTVTTTPTGTTAFNSDGTLTPWSRKRIPEIMFKRHLDGRHLCSELGLNTLDQSVMTAVRRGTRVKSSIAVAAVEVWLTKNAKV